MVAPLINSGHILNQKLADHTRTDTRTKPCMEAGTLPKNKCMLDYELCMTYKLIAHDLAIMTCSILIHLLFITCFSLVHHSFMTCSGLVSPHYLAVLGMCPSLQRSGSTLTQLARGLGSHPFRGTKYTIASLLAPACKMKPQIGFIYLDPSLIRNLAHLVSPSVALPAKLVMSVL